MSQIQRGTAHVARVCIFPRKRRKTTRFPGYLFFNERRSSKSTHIFLSPNLLTKLVAACPVNAGSLSINENKHTYRTEHTFFSRTTTEQAEREKACNRREKRKGQIERERERKRVKLAVHTLGGIYFKVASVLFRSRVSRSILF